MNHSHSPFSVSELLAAIRQIKEILFTRHLYHDRVGRIVESVETTDIFFEDDANDAEIEQLHHEIKELQKLIYRDELAGALNRRGIKDEFGNLFKEALFSREHSELRRTVVIADFSIVFIDLDNFKKINDTYGHEEGDRVLKEVASILHRHVRGIDAVGRLGGEEFVVALLGASEDAAYTKAQEIREVFKRSVRISGDHFVTASLGVASLSQSKARTLDELITKADKAMYEAKHNRGKDTVVRYSELTV